MSGRTVNHDREVRMLVARGPTTPICPHGAEVSSVTCAVSPTPSRASEGPEGVSNPTSRRNLDQLDCLLGAESMYK